MAGEEKRRYALLDALRGLCVVSMVLYHGAYDLVHMLGVSLPWLHALPGYLWQQSICWTFILLSGFCWSFSRRPVQRGLLLVFWSLVITGVTYFFLPEELIFFGVLYLLGTSGLFLALFHALGEKLSGRTGRALSPWLGLLLCALLFFVTREVPHGFLGFEGWRFLRLPELLYRTGGTGFGFPGAGFRSSDYFPLIPWFFLYGAGHFLKKLLDGKEQAERFLAQKPAALSPLCWVGRHSLLIYLLHQPALYGLVLLAGKL